VGGGGRDPIRILMVVCASWDCHLKCECQHARHVLEGLKACKLCFGPNERRGRRRDIDSFTSSVNVLPFLATLSWTVADDVCVTCRQCFSLRLRLALACRGGPSVGPGRGRLSGCRRASKKRCFTPFRPLWSRHCSALNVGGDVQEPEPKI
jgi:hypothetical protein